MKKMFALVAVAFAVTACGGTVADEQNELQTTQSALEGAPNLQCSESCNCWNPLYGGQCGWICGKSWSSTKGGWVYYTATTACNVGSTVCTSASYRRDCTTCVEGSVSATPHC